MPLPNRVRDLDQALILLGCGIAAAVFLLILDLAWPHLLEPDELRTVDRRFQYRSPIAVAKDPKQEKSDEFVIIDYDDAAAAKHGLGRWPWDRRVHAQLIDWLKESGARLIVPDLLFNHGTRDLAEDAALVEATRRAGNVIYPFVFQPVAEEKAGEAFRQRAGRFLLEGKVSGNGEIPGVDSLMLPLAGLLDNALSVGHILRTPDTDGALRRIPLVTAVKGGFAPALALSVAFRQLNVDPQSLVIERGSSIRFKTKHGSTISVPIDDAGRTWINYAGPWGERFQHFSYSWMLDQFQLAESKAELAKRFKDKTVILANLTTGSGDMGATPYERDSPYPEVHLHLLNMLSTQQFLRDPRKLEVLAAFCVPLAILTLAALAGGAMIILPTFAILLLGYLTTLQIAFNSGLILPALPPVLMMILATLLLLAARFTIVDRERRRVLDILDHYLPPQTRVEVRKNPARVQELLKVRTRELTVMFTDVAGFTAFCEKSDPRVVQDFLETYLPAFSEIAHAHGGTVDRYIGDGMLIFFGDAEPEPEEPAQRQSQVERYAAAAVKAAIEMQLKMRELNRQALHSGTAQHLVRIGINTGYMKVGNLGTKQLWDYTVVGTEANKGQRLEASCIPGELLLSHRTYSLARNRGIVPANIEPMTHEFKGMGKVEAYSLPPDYSPEGIRD